MSHDDLDLKELVRTIPDYPKAGILFRDITTLIGHAEGFRAAIRRLAAPFEDLKVDAVAGIEARGFIVGGSGRRQAGHRLRSDPQEGKAAVARRGDI